MRICDFGLLKGSTYNSKIFQDWEPTPHTLKEKFFPPRSSISVCARPHFEHRSLFYKCNIFQAYQNSFLTRKFDIVCQIDRILSKSLCKHLNLSHFPTLDFWQMFYTTSLVSVTSEKVKILLVNRICFSDTFESILPGLSTSALLSNTASHCFLCESIPTIQLRKRFFIQDCANNFEYEKTTMVHLIVFHCKKIHSWRTSSSFKIHRSYLFSYRKVGDPIRLLHIWNFQHEHFLCKI